MQTVIQIGKKGTRWKSKTTRLRRKRRRKRRNRRKHARNRANKQAGSAWLARIAARGNIPPDLSAELRKYPGGLVLKKVLGRALTAGEYREYLFSPHWRCLRKRVLRRDSYKCACRKRAAQVHHKHYTMLGKERLNDLVALCRECHKAKHAPIGARKGADR